MTDLDLMIRAPRMVSTAGEMSRIVGVKDGTIVAIEPMDSDLTAPQVLELADDEVLLPGLVDTHVHVNEPGRTEWEGFASATRGRGRRRRHDDRRHAAEQHPADRRPWRRSR